MKSSIVIMLSIPKTSRCKLLSETLAIPISMHKVKKFHVQINDHLKHGKSIVTSIIYRHNRQPIYSFQLTNLADQPVELDEQARRLFIRLIERNPRNNLKALGILSKSGQTSSRATVQKSLKADRYIGFKA